MKVEEWLQYFDDNRSKFEWFIKEYFKPELLNMLNESRLKSDINQMMSIMNDVWFYLPDGKFNIDVNPKGWNEFLHLLENEVE